MIVTVVILCRPDDPDGADAWEWSADVHFVARCSENFAQMRFLMPDCE